MNDDLKLIKSKYGEKMMHLCRELFPTLLENPGLLFKLLNDNFAPSKFLYNDIIEQGVIEEFQKYIYNLVDIKIEEVVVDKTPKELLDEAGYILYECKTENDIQNFKKYYKKNEELCTFNGGRLNSCYVFFAVKKNVDEIKREDFNVPERQDEYGTSVISIQFSKGNENMVSIKNRYNHVVNNPDATFNNNLDNIIKGLTKSFCREYNLNINESLSSSFELDNYVRATDGKFYKYNYEINNIYYCPNNIIIDNFNVVKTFEEKEKYLIIDYFIIDLKNKKVINYNKINDCIFSHLQNIKKIEINKLKDSNNKLITIDTGLKYPIYIEINSTNNIISYCNNNVENIEDYFLYYNETLENLQLYNAKIIGDKFCHYNKKMVILCLPNVIKIGDMFLCLNFMLKNIQLPKVNIIGDNFMLNNRELEQIQIPLLEEVGSSFLFTNFTLKKLDCPSLIKTKEYFLYSNKVLNELTVPQLMFAGEQFMYWNEELIQLDLQKDINVLYGFFEHNDKLKIHFSNDKENIKHKVKVLNRKNW